MKAKPLSEKMDTKEGLIIEVHGKYFNKTAKMSRAFMDNMLHNRTWYNMLLLSLN